MLPASLLCHSPAALLWCLELMAGHTNKQLSGPARACRLVEAAADTRKAVEAVNRERKLAQTSAAASLSDIEARWLTAVAKNREIEAACEALEARASALTASLPAQYGPPAQGFCDSRAVTQYLSVLQTQKTQALLIDTHVVR